MRGKFIDRRWAAPYPAAMHLTTRPLAPDDRAQVIALYDAVGWGAYTADPGRLIRALAGSAVVATAWDGGELVGLARVLSDGETIAYLQDILVRPDHQRRGIGARLLQTVLEPVAQVRQTVLLTDDEPGQRAFYESMGFTEAHDHSPGMRSFVRLQP